MTASETNFGMTKKHVFHCVSCMIWHISTSGEEFSCIACKCLLCHLYSTDWAMSCKCLGCGRSGHRLESCKTKAAREIRRLRAELQRRHRDNARANPGRKTRKTGKRKLAARKAYAKKNVRRTYEQKRQVDSNKIGTAFVCVCKCKRRSQSVAWRACESAREDPRA